MKKIFIVIFLLITFSYTACAEVLRANIDYTEKIKAFYGIWHVTSKIDYTNNYKIFNMMSVDIWNLSGADGVLFLENGLTGAKSSITIDKEDFKLDGKTLKFKRVKEFSDGKFNYKHTETPEFLLEGNIFRGYDTFKIEKFDFDGNPISVDVVKYKVVGQKIAGD